MIKGKKGVSLPVEFLVRVLIMIFLVIVVVTIGKTVGKSLFAGFFGNDLEKNFDEFVDELNKPFSADVPSRQAFITLDTNTAIVGFSRNANSFKCFKCGFIDSSAPLTSEFEKPDTNECNQKACVCLCPKALQITSSKPYKMKCDKPKCRTLNKELAESVELKNYIEKIEKEQQIDYSFLKNAKWDGGFLFERHSRATFISNGLPQPPGRRFTVYVNKEGTGNNYYLTICPGPDCKYSFEQPKAGIPEEICQLIDKCIEKENVARTTIGARCFPKSPQKTMRSNEDCEKVLPCVRSEIKSQTLGKCAGIDLTFLE